MGPLTGIRVLDLTKLLPGPLTTHYLVRLGATVIKVEPPAIPAPGQPSEKGKPQNKGVPSSGSGDYVRFIPPMIDFRDEDTQGNVFNKKHGLLFESLNAGKLGLAVDARNPKGIEVLRKVAESVDVIVEGHRPGVMDRIGLGYNDIRKVNPGVVYCSISGYGASGPYMHRAGHDVNYMATAGALGLTGAKDSTPPVLGFQAADVAGTLHSVIGILAALFERKSTNVGQFVDISLTESALGLSLTTLVYGLLGGGVKAPERGQGILDGGLANYRVYSTSDNKHLSVGALESQFWVNICKAVNRDDLIEKPNVAEVEALFASKTQKEWVDIFSPLDACVEAALGVDEVFDHPQHVARQVTLPGKHANEPRQVVLGPRLSNHNTPRLLKPAPAIGEHTAEILSASGFTQEQVSDLEKEHVVSVFVPKPIGKPTQFKPMRVPVEAGKTYFWCSCGLSENQPFCDGKHKGSQFKPVKFVAETSEDYPFCACRLSGKTHRCDGTHKKHINSQTTTKP